MKLPTGADHLSWRNAQVLLGVLSATLYAGCSIEAPSSSTSTNFVISIPVANDSTRIEELVGDRDDFLEIDPTTGGMKLRVALPLPSNDPSAPSEILGIAEVGSNLKVTPTANRFSTAIGELSIPGQTIPEIAVGFGAITGQNVAAGTVIPAIPGTSFGTAVPLPLANVTSLSITTGGLDVVVDNDMPIALSGVILSLFDEQAGAAIDEIDLGTIPASGGRASGSFELAGRTISGDLSVEVSGNTVAATNVTAGANDELRINAVLQALLVSEATALIPQQEFEDRQTLDFPDDRIQVTAAGISEGGLTLVVTNNIPIVMEVELTLPDLVDAEGNPQSFLLESLLFGEPREINFDLTNNVFAPADPLQMRIEYRARTFDSDTQVTIASNGEIDIEAVTEELVFSRVQGSLNEIRLEIPKQSREVEFPAGLDNVNIATASLAVHVTSGVSFLADVDILFTGVNDKGETGTLVVRETFERGDPAAPKSDTLFVSSAQFTDFLNLLPTSITVEPVIIVGDGLEEEIIEADHFVALDSVVFRTEPRLTVLSDTRIDPDVQDISFRDSESRGRIETNFISASVLTEIESRIPLGVGVRLMVASTPEAVYDTNSADFVAAIPGFDQGRFEVAAAPVDANGVASGTTTSTIEIDLTKNDVLKFILEDDGGSLYSGVRVTLPSSGGEVEIRANDFINVIAGLRVELELNKDLVE
ncbi:MAG: hypothetical protein O2782_05260 [bacterium]|nr:hypothetical protein [bacterium]